MLDDAHAMRRDEAARPTATPLSPAAPGPTAVRLPYSHTRRVGYGLLWAAWTLALTIAGFAGLFGGHILSGLFALVLAVIAGRYDYRIWTWRARRLLFLIIW